MLIFHDKFDHIHKHFTTFSLKSIHNNVPFAINMSCRCLPLLNLIKVEWILISSHSVSYSNIIIPIGVAIVITSVDFTIQIQLEQLLKLNSIIIVLDVDVPKQR